MRPPPPRPPDFDSPSMRLFSGLPLCSSERSTSTSPRRDGEVGLKVFKAMVLKPRRDIDGLAGRERHDGLLYVRAAPEDAAEALGLAFDDQRVDLDHVDLEQLLDRLGDLVLGGVLGDAEHDLVLLGQ